MTRTVQRLATIGKQLAHPPHTKDAILKQLKQAAEMLSEMKQSQEARGSIEPLIKALVLPMLLKHKDKDVRLLATSCIMEVLRIVAPDAPYSDKELQDIFQEVVSAFEGLNDTSSPSFARRTAILEIMANLRICVVMLDVGCDDLITDMFRIFFSVVSDKHPQSVLSAMQTAMAAVLEESEKIPMALLDMILTNLLKHKKGVSPAAHKLAVGVVRHCAEKLEPYVQRLLTSVMVEGRRAEVDLHADYHDIILEIYQCAPEMLLAVIPNLKQELVNDQISVRLKAVKLLGRLFALPGQHVAKEYRQLFLEFLKRFTDKAVEVRLAMLDCAKECLKANPSGIEALEILNALDERLLDCDEVVRLRTVAVICDLTKYNAKWVPVSLLKHVADRLRDKKIPVRKEAFQRLTEVYRAYTMKCKELINKDLEWILGKLLRCCFDKDVKEFRPGTLEILLAEKLFWRQASVRERAKHWVAMYSFFDEIDKKALTKILSQKKRLQDDMSKYLALRQKEKELGEEQSEIQQLFKRMALLFVEEGKVEEHFQKLHNMKDNKIFKALSDLLNPYLGFTETESIIDDLLKRVGEHHPQHDFIKNLAIRCSFLMFGKDHVKAIVEGVSSNEGSSNGTAASGLSVLAEFAGYFPALIQPVREELLRLLLEGDDVFKERVAEILARAGSSLCGLDGISSSVENTLQKLCLEGTRKQAKYAVAALAALNTDEGFQALSVLYGWLLGQLQEDNPHLPTVLQSLACIAERAITIFETQENEIVRFVVRSLLQKDSDEEIATPECEDWEKLSRICQLKVYGLKALVKSFLPFKQHPRRRLRGLLGLLSKVLPNGEIAEAVKSSENDKAHLRLASVKGLLRLARRWDAHIPPPIFHLCLLMSQDPCVNVRQGLLKKLHQYLRDHSLSHKYASGYALFAMDSSKEILADVKHHLTEFIESARLEARAQQKPLSNSDVSLITYNPEYVLTYLVHVLAHHPSFPSSESENADMYEPFYRVLLFYLRPLVNLDNEVLGKGGSDNVPAILAIFRTIKKAEDALEGTKTANLHLVCDFGIAIVKELGSSTLYSDTYPGLVPLPSSLYRVKDDEGSVDVGKEDGSDLPSCLTETDALSLFWSRGSRNAQIHPIASNQQTKKVKKDVEESTSSEKNGTEGDREKENLEVKSKDGSKARKKRPARRRRARARASDEESAESLSDFEEEDGEAMESPSSAARQKLDEAGSGVRDGAFAPENRERPTRVTRSQAVGMRIVMGSRAISSPDTEQANGDHPSVTTRKTVAKRLKLDKQPGDGEEDGSLPSEGAVEQESRRQTRSMKDKLLLDQSGEEHESYRKTQSRPEQELGSHSPSGKGQERPRQTRSKKDVHVEEIHVSISQGENEHQETKSKSRAAKAHLNLAPDHPTLGDTTVVVEVSPSRSLRPRHGATWTAEASSPNGTPIASAHKSPNSASEGRALRKRGNIAEQKALEQDSTESEEETTATWRSRRRKVQ